MKNYIFSLIFFFTFSFGSFCMVWSGDFKSAMKAYEKGDYTYAVKELKLLAKIGHAKAQHFLGDMYYKGKGVNQNYKSAGQKIIEAQKNNFGGVSIFSYTVFKTNPNYSKKLNKYMD